MAEHVCACDLNPQAGGWCKTFLCQMTHLDYAICQGVAAPGLSEPPTPEKRARFVASFARRCEREKARRAGAPLPPAGGCCG